MSERTLTDGRAALARRAEIRGARAIRDHELAASERAAFYRVLGAPRPPRTHPQAPAALEAGEVVEGAGYVDGAGYYWTDEIRGWELAR